MIRSSLLVIFSAIFSTLFSQIQQDSAVLSKVGANTAVASSGGSQKSHSVVSSQYDTLIYAENTMRDNTAELKLRYDSLAVQLQEITTLVQQIVKNNTTGFLRTSEGTSLDSLPAQGRTTRSVIDRIGFGFDETGISYRHRPFARANSWQKNLLITTGAMFDIVMPQNPYQQSLRKYHLKIATSYDLFVYPRMRISGYGEFMHKMVEFETDPLLGETVLSRYPIWGYKARLGVLLTVFTVERFIVTYRIGGEYAYYSPIYRVNEKKTSLKKVGNGTVKIGLAGSETMVLETLINNFGIYFYF